MDDTVKQILTGVALALPSFLLGLLGWIQVRKKGTTDYSSKQIDQLLQGYRDFTQEVQADNEDLRAEVSKLKDQYKLCEEGRVTLTKEHAQLKRDHQRIKETINALSQNKTQ